MADHIVEFVCPACQTHRFDKPHEVADQFSACPVCNGEPSHASVLVGTDDARDTVEDG